MSMSKTLMDANYRIRSLSETGAYLYMGMQGDLSKRFDDGELAPIVMNCSTAIFVGSDEECEKAKAVVGLKPIEVKVCRDHFSVVVFKNDGDRRYPDVRFVPSPDMVLRRLVASCVNGNPNFDRILLIPWADAHLEALASQLGVRVERVLDGSAQRG